MNLVDMRIVTTDVPRLVRFYQQVTGLGLVQLDADYAELRTPGGVLAITAQRKLEMRRPSSSPPSTPRR